MPRPSKRRKSSREIAEERERQHKAREIQGEAATECGSGSSEGEQTSLTVSEGEKLGEADESKLMATRAQWGDLEMRLTDYRSRETSEALQF